MPAASTTSPIQERFAQYMIPNLPRYPVTFLRGAGCKLWDEQGREYLDLFAGFGAPILGHCAPDLVRAVTEQAQKLWHVGNLYYTEPQTRAAAAISRHSFGGQVFFCHAGADANEAAIKLARLWGHTRPGKAGPRYKVISATRSFHGRSFGTMGATGNPKVREGFGPLTPGFVNVAYNDIDAVAQEVDDLATAVLVEPIQGEGGIQVPEADYFAKLRQLCDDHDMLLLCDEVWTGCGRTGKYFGYQHWCPDGDAGAAPDVISLGKGVGGGLAVGAICAQGRAAELYDYSKQGIVRHATTLGGNCLGMAVTAEIFHVLERDGLVARAALLGERVKARLNAFAKQHPLIKEVRGLGLFLGVELSPGDGGTKAWFENAGQVAQKCLDRGLVVNATQNVVLRLAPPLTISETELDQGLGMLEEVLLGEG